IDLSGAVNESALLQAITRTVRESEVLSIRFRIFIPIIVAYTSWVYRVLWGKVDEKAIRDESGHAY
ncbi:hypothetical protein EN799_66095, partial [bacterium M00.F.Ca.ET.156.01.1.1]